MTPTRTRPPHRSALVAATVTAALVAGCTSSESPNGQPDGTGPPTVGSSSLDEEAASALYVAWQEIVATLPPTDPEDLDPTDHGDGIVVPGSPAANDTTNTLEAAITVGVIARGDVAAETIAIQPLGNLVAQAELCVSHDVQVTFLDSGEPLDTTNQLPDEYQRVQVIYQLQDETWLIESGEGLDPRPCVPPSIEAAVRANWQSYLTAHAAYLRAGRGAQNIGDLQSLTTGVLLDRLRQSPGGTPIEYADTEYDLQLHLSTRTQVVGDWCYDGNRNPEAGGTRDDGTFVKHTHRQAETDATWELVDGQWLLSSYVSLQPDDPGAPEEHRCF